MNHQSSRLVDGQDAGIFVEDLHRDILRRCFQRGQFGGFHCDGFSAVKRRRWLGGRAVHCRSAILDPTLQASAAELRQLLLQKMVEPLPGVLLCDL